MRPVQKKKVFKGLNVDEKVVTIIRGGISITWFREAVLLGHDEDNRYREGM